MRVAIVTESFLPQVNGVSNTVRHVVDELVDDHEILVVAPGPGPAHHEGVPVVRVRSVGMPGYRSFPIGLPDAAVGHSLDRFGPDLVHLASPIALGVVGLRAARRLGVPTVAVYQTDIAGFARQYGLRADLVVDRWVGRLHRRVDRTLVPSTASKDQLAALGVRDLHLWRRGIALDLFDPSRRSRALHERWTDGRRMAVGYVGRLAHEKQVHRLAVLAGLPGVQLVVVGDGPAREELQRQLPGAVFTGMLRGADLAAAYASLDVFVHTGDHETFCQTVQEAQASGVPVVAPAAGGPLDLVDPGRTGLLFDPADLGSLRDCVAKLMAAPGLRQDLATRARAAVAGRTWAGVVDELVDVHYRAVLDDALSRQARAVRAVIGKPLGEEALRGDRVYKRKYGDPLDLLLLGDSIAAGLGAERPQDTLGGQLARRLAKATHRSVRLHTAAVVGAESSGLAEQLATLPPAYVPHVAVIVVGGNDITHRVRTAESRRHLGDAVRALRELGAGVVVGTCPDLGALQPLPQPLRALGARASRQLAAVQRDVTTELGGHAVSLADVVGPFFITQPDEMFALDRFHPSGAGYRRTARAMLPSVLAALGYADSVPFGHHPPASLVEVRGAPAPSLETS